MQRYELFLKQAKDYAKKRLLCTAIGEMWLAFFGGSHFFRNFARDMENEFDDIRPYEPQEMKQAFEGLLSDRQFNVIMKGYVPWLPKGLRNGLLRIAFMGVKTPLDFQLRFMKPIVKYIIRRHTDGCTFDDTALATLPSPPTSQRYTFVSNHRDIVLDSAFLDVKLIEAGYPTTVEIGIGDNLLIFPWIKRLVRMNKAFTVRRGLTPKEMLASSQLMSRYIHYAVTHKMENIWIAQREGRAKDSDDRTHDAVLKMLAMGGSVEGGSPADSLRELNIVPLTISYEYDPCDYFKAQEMQQRRDDPAFRKSKQDDLDNMRTGILGYKGCVHYHCGTPINTWIDELEGLPRKEFYQQLALRMDQEIHAGYRIFPSNRVAMEMLNGNDAQDGGQTQESAPTTVEERQHFEEYLEGQLAKISLPDKDEPFLRRTLLTMYANPLRNKLNAMASLVMLLTFLFSCSNDVYDKGDGDYSLMEAEMADVYVNAKLQADHLLTDEGERLQVTSPFTKSWMKTPDSTYRAVTYFNRTVGGVELMGVNRVGVAIPKKINDMKTDPVHFESLWMSRSGRYLNMSFYLLVGSTSDENALHTLGCCNDTLVSNADGSTTQHLIFYHDQGGMPEYYSQRTYVSIPLTDIHADSVALTIHTYDGIVSKTICLTR